MQLERLDKTKHDRKAFDCGVSALNAFLQTQARQDAERHFSVSYVLAEGAQILGYFSLSTYALELGELSLEMQQRLPKHALVPAMLLGRLAVDRSQQGKGLGLVLLTSALKKVASVALEAGVHLLVVDALDDGAASFYQKFGFVPLPEQPLKLFLPMTTILKSLAQTVRNP